MAVRVECFIFFSLEIINKVNQFSGAFYLFFFVVVVASFKNQPFQGGCWLKAS
jgi:hypothetical protein